MSDALIRGALRSRLLTVPGLPALQAWEGMAFDPATVPTGQAWVRDAWVPGTETRRTKPAKDAWVEQLGLYEAHLFFPQDRGTADADALATAVREHFPPGLSLAVGTTGRPVVVDRTRRFAGRPDPHGWYHVAVQVDWYRWRINTL